MPVPKRKRSRARRDKRFANKGLQEKAIQRCKTEGCSAALVPHQACYSCGFYKGVKVLRTKNERGKVRSQKKEAKKEATPTETE